MGDEYRSWCQPSNSTSSPPSSSSLTGMETFLWPMEIDTDTKTSSSLHPQRADTGVLLPIHNIEMMSLRPSYPPITWNQPFLRGGGEEPELHQNFTKIQQQQGGVWKEKLYYGESEGQIIKSSDQLQYHQNHGGCSSEGVNCSQGENMMLPFFRNDDNYTANCNMNVDNMDGSGISYPDVLSNSTIRSRQLIISNLSPLWNSTVDVPHTGLIPLTQPLIQHGRLAGKSKGVRGETAGVVYKKHGKEMGVGKRQRSEVGGGLPAFKVRKEKMGDRITTLQQLVSPFGKTDTASVLSEAIEYIKFLHQQVFVLCAPYINSGAGLQHTKVIEEGEGEGSSTKKDLKSKGLCMVPMSSTFAMVNENSVDFLTPTYGGTFR